MEPEDYADLIVAVEQSTLPTLKKMELASKLATQPMLDRSAKDLANHKVRALRATLDAVMEQHQTLVESVGNLVALLSALPEANNPEAQDAIEGMRQVILRAYNTRAEVAEMLDKEVWKQE